VGRHLRWGCYHRSCDCWVCSECNLAHSSSCFQKTRVVPSILHSHMVRNIISVFCSRARLTICQCCILGRSPPPSYRPSNAHVRPNHLPLAFCHHDSSPNPLLHSRYRISRSQEGHAQPRNQLWSYQPRSLERWWQLPAKIPQIKAESAATVTEW
jgi:hypothetical protein